MMGTNMIFLLTLLSYSIIVSQSFSYIISLKNVQLSFDAPSYIKFRKLTDTNFRAKYKYPVYAALLSNILLVILNIKNPSGLLFITATIAYAALLTDTVLTLKGNMPINNLINTWSVNNYPADWTDYRAKWLNIFQYRQIANIIGFVSLLIGAVFGVR
jgi:hypothetical protein